MQTDQNMATAAATAAAEHLKGIDAEMDEIIQVASQYGQQEHSNQNSSKASPPSLAGTTAPTSEDDNMDFDSDDDDEDESKSNHSSSLQGGGRRRKKWSHIKGDIKRSHHNVLERKRRDLIKDSFSKLRECVPTLSNERAPRAQILKKAADFIQMTNQKNDATRSSIEELVRKNAELERIISAAKQNNATVKQEPNAS